MDYMIKATQMNAIWKTVTVRGVTPTTPIETIEQHFSKFGEVKDIGYSQHTFKNITVKSNKLTMKLKMEDDKKPPVFIMNQLREGWYEKWEVSYQGSPKVCLQCCQTSHIKRD